MAQLGEWCSNRTHKDFYLVGNVSVCTQWSKIHPSPVLGSFTLTKFISENISNIVVQYCLAFLPWSSDWNWNDPFFGAPRQVHCLSLSPTFRLQTLTMCICLLTRKNFGAQSFWRSLHTELSQPHPAQFASLICVFLHTILVMFFSSKLDLKLST